MNCSQCGTEAHVCDGSQSLCPKCASGPVGSLTESELDRYREAIGAGQNELLAKLFLHLDGAARLGQWHSFDSFKRYFALAGVRLVPADLGGGQ